jgi:hypothetical protein
MNAKLKEIYSLELDQPLDRYCPKDPENYAISIRLMIGPENQTASESFDVLVCTPTWLTTHYAKERLAWGHHFLIVLDYDFALIKGEIERKIAACSGKDWPTSAQKLSKYAAWEFTDYQS